MADLHAAAVAYLAGTGDPPDRMALAEEVVRLHVTLAAVTAARDDAGRTIESTARDRDDRLTSAIRGMQRAEGKVLELRGRMVDAERERDNARRTVGELEAAYAICDTARVDALQAHADAAEVRDQVTAERDRWKRRAVSAALLIDGLTRERDAMRRDVEAAAGRLGVPLDEMAPGSTACRLVVANRLLIAERDRAWSARCDWRRLFVEMRRRRDRLAIELANYEVNHGARCEAEQERLATIAESACRMLASARDRMLATSDAWHLIDVLASDFASFLSLPSHEVPELRAQVAARDAALEACQERIAELLSRSPRLDVADALRLLDPLDSHLVGEPRRVVRIAVDRLRAALVDVQGLAESVSKERA